MGSSLEWARPPAGPQNKDTHHSIIKVVIHTGTAGVAPTRVMASPLPRHPDLDPGYVVRPVQPISTVAQDEDGDYYINATVEWTSVKGELWPGTPLVEIHSCDEGEY